jgi:hypothetical protein
MERARLNLDVYRKLLTTKLEGRLNAGHENGTIVASANVAEAEE